MNEFAHWLMKGRRGAWGHMTHSGETSTLYARGLEPGKAYAFRGWNGEVLAQGKADGAGSLVLAGPFSAGFLACGGQAVLWAEGPGEAEAYLRACRCLDGQKPRKEPENSGAPLPDAAPPQLLPEAPEETLVDSPAAEQTPSPAPKAYSLRPDGPGEPVDGLPCLTWPQGTEEISRYARVCPPWMPFDAPGWRFFRAPSPGRAAAYCLMGYFAWRDRVTAVAIAVPGTPYRPPTGEGGYRYRPGRGGMGYWIRERQV